jgi:hypothetical protein
MSSTEPPEGARERASSTPFATVGSPGDIARLPIPGNAEFVFLLVALILLAIIAAIADRYDTAGWVHSLEWLGAAYLVSRGIAKASRVLEQ